MNKLMLISCVLFFVACDTQRLPEVLDPHHCNLPAEIPDTLNTGEKVYWDCVWQEAYNSGKVRVVRDSTGGVIAVARF